MPVDSLFLDIRQTARHLARRPGFLTTAVLSLAIGLGVNTAIFSALSRVLFSSLPVKSPERTVYIFQSTAERADGGSSFPGFEAYRASSAIFESVMAFAGARPVLLSDGERRESIYAELVTSGFFSIANIRLQSGQPFDAGIDAIGNAASVVIVSDRCWRLRFGSNPGIVGQSVVLNGRPFTIGAVAAPEFTGFDAEVSVDVWMPATTWARLVSEPARLTSEEHWLTTIARLRDGVTLEQAEAAMSALDAAREPAAPGRRTHVRPIGDRAAGSQGEALAIGGAAFGAGFLVLALACANVASLFIARAASRRREMSVRLALGASRWRVLRLWLVETTMVACGGGVAGLFVAWAVLRVFIAVRMPVWIGHADDPALPIEFHLTAPVVAFAAALVIVTSLVIAGLAGVHTSRSASVRDRIDRRFAPGFNVRSGVLALQMALALALLIPCGLLLRSWQHAAGVDPGFSTQNVVLLPISTDQAGVRVKKPEGFEETLLERVAVLPEVESATAMDPVPLWFTENATIVSIESSTDRARVSFSRVAPHYFATLGIPVLRGRDFTAADSRTAPGVAIVNETMARTFWADGDALGRQIREGSDVIEIVGIARDSTHSSLGERSRPWLYRPLSQAPTDNVSVSLAVRFKGDASRVRDRVQREVLALIPTWPAFRFRTLDEGVDLQRTLPRLGATLLGGLGVTGLLLASIGMYGVTSYVARHRRREIGIRLALGSPVRDVVALVVRQGLGVCAAGASIGLALAFGLSRLLQTVLIGVSAIDPLTYVIVTFMLFAAAGLACYGPARAAAVAPPLATLRDE